MGEVCDVEWGNTSLTKKAFVENGKFLAVSAAGMDGRIDHSEHAAMIPVISAIGANCGRMFLPEEPFTAVKNTMTVTPHLGLDSRFVFFGLSSIELPRRGAAQPFLALGDIRKIPFQIPPLEEQERIVEVLDEAFAAIDKAKANIERNLVNLQELSDTFMSSVCEDLKAYDQVPFGSLVELSRGHNPPKKDFESTPSAANIRFWQIRDGWSDKYKVYVPKTPKLHLVEEHEILMVAYRHIGKAFRGVKGAFNVALCKVTNANESILDSDFLFELIPSSFIRGELLKLSERSLIPSMSVKELAKLPFPLPTMEMQRQFVDQIIERRELCDTLKSKYQSELDNLDELRQSILEQAFEGKLTEPVAA